MEVAKRFAIVPERLRLLDADVSDTAIRLYAVLLPYGQSSGARMPGRASPAGRSDGSTTLSLGPRCGRPRDRECVRSGYGRPVLWRHARSPRCLWPPTPR